MKLRTRQSGQELLAEPPGARPSRPPRRSEICSANPSCAGKNSVLTGRRFVENSNLRISLLATLVACVLFVLGCSRAPEENSNSASPTAGSGNATSGGGSLFETLSRSMQGVRSFRARITNPTPQNGSQEMSMEVVMPDRVRIFSDQMEMIAVGKTGYLKTPAGWQSVPLPDELNLGDLKNIQEELKNANAVREKGTELVDGVETVVYEAAMTGTNQKGTNQNMPDSFEIWIAKSDGLPRRLEAKGAGVAGKTTVVYYDYNADIRIEPPVR